MGKKKCPYHMAECFESCNKRCEHNILAQKRSGTDILRKKTHKKMKRGY